MGAKPGLTEDIHLDVQAQASYYAYGVAVNEERSVPALIDGLKPVQRRVLWATYKLGATSGSKVIKSARIVGDVIGKYHPHGDVAAYQSMVNMANSCVPTIKGEGNWGTLASPGAAAYRYTNAKLSKYSDTIFFDRFYLPTVDYLANFDGTEKEPLILPALLPNLLLNGTFGIGVGVSTSIPSFTLNSLIKILKKALSGEPLDYKLCAGLDFTTKYKGTAVKVKADIKTLHKTGSAKVEFQSVHTHDAKKNRIVFTKFAPINYDKVLEKATCVKGVTRVNDSSKAKDSHYTITINLKRTLKGKEFEKVEKQLVSIFSANENFDIKVTNRLLNKLGKPESKLTNSTVPKIIEDWIQYRVDLEKKACTYWIGKADEKIAYLNLLRKAVANRALIIKALDKNCSEEELAKFIAKSLKITEDEANKILDLRVRQLRALEDKKLVDQIKVEEAEKKALQGRVKHPKEYINTQLDTLAKLCKV